MVPPPSVSLQRAVFQGKDRFGFSTIFGSWVEKMKVVPNSSRICLHQVMIR